MRWQTTSAPWLLALLVACHVGCSTLSGRPWGGTSTAASKPAGGEVRQVSHIEDRYREEYDPIKKPKVEGFDAFKPEVIKAQVADLTGNGPNAATAKQLFAQAEDLYAKALDAPPDRRAAAFSEAAEAYVAAAEKWPESLLEEDALFLAAESYFFSDQYPLANEQYEKLIKQHPNTRHMDAIDARRFAIAQYWLELDKKSPQNFFSVNMFDKSTPWRDTRGHAFRVYDKIRVDDPTGKLSDDATLAAANAYFARGDFFKADQLYTDLRKTFPSSEHQFLAHFLGLKAKLSIYEGPDYAGTPLDECEQLIKQIRRQFPQQADQEKEYLTRAYAEVRFKKAERIWTMGRYHELRKEYRASKFYYDQIVKDFADTPFSAEAATRVQANASEPPVPPQKLEWLVDLFPERENAKPLLSSSTPEAGAGTKRR
jgi:outer membrane protein assembly factor BamD (BamD/ComL family)